MQERIPIYLAAIGPKNTTLAAEIADGWIPTLFSPEHVAEFRPLLEEGFARAGGGKGFDDFEIAPMVNVMVTDDVDAARDAMRHYVALYVGGMGSRDKNFYNALVQRYGFEDAAREVQDLYLEGKKDEAAAALPAELIDTVSLCGPPDVVRERLAVFRDAGVGTLMVAPMAWTRDDRARAAPAPRRAEFLRVLLGAFGDPGHAFPMLALGEALVARGHEVALQTWRRWEDAAVAAGMTFAAAPEYQVFPTRERPLKPYAAAVRAAAETRPVVRSFAPDVAVSDILTPAPALAAELEGVPVATLVPHVHPHLPPGFPPYAIGARLPRTALGRALWRAHRPAGRERARAGPARVQRVPRPARARPAAVGAHGHVAVADAGGDAAAARVPARLAGVAARRRAADVGAAGRARRRRPPGSGPGRAGGAVDRAGPRAPAAARGARRAWRTSRCA